ncbi:uncharacterized protein LOC112270807 isoform X2 [Brachypodium distachyon]|uniref:uncharacterized protein LOC112270807 isoform X2 n=1 Tax=Brachypodium distachyon TaxID=15368 RepID=UPI000D0DB01D|nr:uncharacterized protein LOC112270807 isoform X2 [Brachypodium distachyon]|eukprot:XP_024314831.1 uncharacterized protein LOC112270807 isoform X2 [Brachypodium distachyon]
MARSRGGRTACSAIGYCWPRWVIGEASPPCRGAAAVSSLPRNSLCVLTAARRRRRCLGCCSRHRPWSWKARRCGGTASERRPTPLPMEKRGSELACPTPEMMKDIHFEERCHIFASTLCCYVEFYLSMKYISDSLLKTEDRQTSPPKSKSTGVMIIMIWERTNSQVLVRKRTTKILEQIRLDMGAWHEEKSHLEAIPFPRSIFLPNPAFSLASRFSSSLSLRQGLPASKVSILHVM